LYCSGGLNCFQNTSFPTNSKSKQKNPLNSISDKFKIRTKFKIQTNRLATKNEKTGSRGAWWRHGERWPRRGSRGTEEREESRDVRVQHIGRNWRGITELKLAPWSSRVGEGGRMSREKGGWPCARVERYHRRTNINVRKYKL
jgi:hypothetical protein